MRDLRSTRDSESVLQLQGVCSLHFSALILFCRKTAQRSNGHAHFCGFLFFFSTPFCFLLECLKSGILEQTLNFQEQHSVLLSTGGGGGIWIRTIAFARPQLRFSLVPTDRYPSTHHCCSERPRPLHYHPSKVLLDRLRLVHTERVCVTLRLRGSAENGNNGCQGGCSHLTTQCK